MIFFYVDDSGDPYAHHEPLLEGETPLFCLSAVALRSSNWRLYDRRFLATKRRYFLNEMAAYASSRPDGRPEHYERKGHDLFKPSHAKDARRQAYAEAVFRLCHRYDARLFSAIWRKDPTNPANPQAIYCKSLQVLAERFQYFCESADEDGLIVVDSRNRDLDLAVASSHLSYVFGHMTGRTLTRLTEAPMFADSRLVAGLQIADIVGACIYGYYYYRRCAFVAALLNGTTPVTAKQLATSPAHSFQVRTPARDYGHCKQYWPILDELQFKRRDIAPPAPGITTPGYFGFREIT